MPVGTPCPAAGDGNADPRRAADDGHGDGAAVGHSHVYAAKSGRHGEFYAGAD